ncbi:MAG: mevalonate kinase [Candidatus Promineifilaceae bacterium]
MAKTTASAPGKIILFGEHAVVYGRPAIAAPLNQVRAEAVVEDGKAAGIYLIAPDINKQYWLSEAREQDPFARAVKVTLETLETAHEPALSITVRSQIPIASGLGSGAAMAAAVIKALYNHLSGEGSAPDELVSSLTYQVEMLLHGTPSGIDNSVVATAKPIYFIRRQPENLIETLEVGRPLRILVADTGVVSRTKEVVGDVRRQWKEQTSAFETLFDHCGRIAKVAREAIEMGEFQQVGCLMTENQSCLRDLTVSSEELEHLIQAAEGAGAIGAKLSGAGRGGNMIALVDQSTAEDVRKALLAAGAKNVLESVIT